MQIKVIHGNVLELLILPIESYNTPQGISPPYIKFPSLYSAEYVLFTYVRVYIK